MNGYCTLRELKLINYARCKMSQEIFNLICALCMIACSFAAIIYITVSAHRVLTRTEDRVYEDRKKASLAILEPIMDTMLLHKEAKDFFGSKKYTKAIAEFKLYGSDKAIKAFNDLAFLAANVDPINAKYHVKPVLRSIADLIIVIRKDIGYSSTILNYVDILRVIISDIDDYKN